MKDYKERIIEKLQEQEDDYWQDLNEAMILRGVLKAIKAAGYVVIKDRREQDR